MTFSVLFNTQAHKSIKKLDNQSKDRIKKKIVKLQEDPFPPDCVRVEEYKQEKIFRVRVGNYRILYLVRYEMQQILIVKIDKRGRVY